MKSKKKIEPFMVEVQVVDYKKPDIEIIAYHLTKKGLVVDAIKPPFGIITGECVDIVKLQLVEGINKITKL